MSVAHYSSKYGFSEGQSTLTIWNVDVGGSDRLLIVGVSIAGDEEVSAVNFGGAALTFLGGLTGVNGRTEIWYLVAPTPGSTEEVVVSFPGGVYAVAGASVYQGVHQGSPLGSHDGASGLGTTISNEVSSATGELVFDVVSVLPGITGTTVGAGQTQRWNNLTWGVRGASSDEAGAATVTMSWALGDTAYWTSSAVSINPSTGPGEYKLGLRESLHLSPVIYTRLSAIRTLVDTITLGDVVSAFRMHYKELTDIITLTEATIAKSVGKYLSDTTMLVEGFMNFSLKRALTDGITLSDVLSVARRLLLIDSITLTGSMNKSLSRVLSEAVSLSDTVVATLVKVLQIMSEISHNLNIRSTIKRHLSIAAKFIGGGKQ